MKSDKQTTVYLDKKDALAKAEHFCAYQERSQLEVRLKLLEWGVKGDTLEEIISNLITDNFLNELRFANHYVSGKFNIKKWGRIKIKQGLKLKGVPEKLLLKALQTIDADDYFQTLQQLAEKKAQSLTEKDFLKRKSKLVYYLQSKGYERDLVFEVVKDPVLFG